MLALLWHELPEQARANQPKARLPWAYLDIDALRQEAKANYYRINFADNPSTRPQVPGITPPLGPPGKAECLDARAPKQAILTAGQQGRATRSRRDRSAEDLARKNAQYKARLEASGKASQTWTAEELHIEAMRGEKKADPQVAAEERAKQRAKESAEKLAAQLKAVTAPPTPGKVRR